MRRIIGAILVLVGVMIALGIIPLPGEVALVVDGNKPYLDIYVSDGKGTYKLVQMFGTIYVTTSFNRIVVCYGDAETGIAWVKAWYKQAQAPSATELKDVTTYFPYTDTYLESLLEKSLYMDITCRYLTFTPQLGVKYGVRAQAEDQAGNLAEVVGYVVYGSTTIQNYKIYFNGKLWDGSSKIYVKPGQLTVKVVIEDPVWIDSISYILKDDKGNVLENEVVTANKQAPLTVEWTIATSLEKGKTYYLAIYARVGGGDYTLASLQLPIQELTGQPLQFKPQTIIGIVIVAIGAVLILYPSRRT